MINYKELHKIVRYILKDNKLNCFAIYNDMRKDKKTRRIKYSVTNKIDDSVQKDKVIVQLRELFKQTIVDDLLLSAHFAYTRLDDDYINYMSLVIILQTSYDKEYKDKYIRNNNTSRVNLNSVI